MPFPESPPPENPTPEKSTPPTNFSIEKREGESGYGFVANGNVTLDNETPSSLPSIHQLFDILVALGLTEQFGDGGHTVAHFINKLKGLRDMPRPDRLYANYNGLTIVVAMNTPSENIVNNTANIKIGVYNKLKRPGWVYSAPPFQTQKKARQAQELLQSLLP